MADTNNPIKYSDLVVPDNAIRDLIAQLEELQETYKAALEQVNKEAIKVTASLNKVSGATKQGRETTKQAATEADRLAAAQKRLKEAQSETAKEIERLKQQTREQQRLTKAQVQANQSAEGSYNKLAAQYAIIKQRLNAMSQAEREGTAAGRELEAQSKKLYERMKELQAATGKMQLNVGNYPQVMQAGQMAAKQFAGAVGGVGVSLGGLAAAATPAGAAMAGVGLAAAGMGKVISDSVEVTKTYNASVSVLAAITGEAVDDLKELTDQAQDLGASTKYTASEVVQLQTELAKLGYTKTEIGNMTQAVLQFAAAADAGLADAASLAGGTLRMFGADSTQVAEYVDKMAGSINKSSISFSYLQTALSTVGPVAYAFGFKIEDVLALLGSLANANFDASSAATASRNIILKLADANGDLAKSLGAPVKDLDGLMKGLKTLQEAGIDLADAAGLADTRSTAAFTTFVNGADATLQLRDALNETEGATGRMAETMSDNLEGDVKSMESAYEGWMITLGGSQGLYRDIVQWITSVLRRVNDWTKKTKEYFSELYQGSTLVRSVLAGVVLAFAEGTDAIKALIKQLGASVKAIANILQGAYELDWDKVKKGWSDFYESTKNNAVNFAKSTVENIKKANDKIENGGKQLAAAQKKQAADAAAAQKKQLETNAEEVKKAAAELARIRNEEAEKERKKNEAEANKARAARERQEREAEQAYKKNLELVRKAQDAEVEMLEDAWEKKRKKTIYQYDREVEDLLHKQQTEKNLTIQARESITQAIALAEQRKKQELEKIANDETIAQLNRERETIKLRLQAVKAGSEEEFALKRQEIAVERQLAIAKNNALTDAEKQSEADIVAVYDNKNAALTDAYIKHELELFGKQQEFAESEFELIKSTEEEKTRYRLQAEKERLQKILELNQTAANKLSDVEVQTMQNTIARLDKQIGESIKKERTEDVYGMLGLKLNEEQKEAINSSYDYAIGQLNNYMQARTDAAQKAVEASQKEVDAAKNRLDKEIEARNNGYANDVENARKELENAKKTRNKALADEKKAQREQIAMQAVQEAGNLVLASTKIWAQLGFPFAIPALAVMWGSFAASKVKAFQMTRSKETYGEGTVELLEGGSHASGNDIDLGTKRDGTRRRAEGGEFFAVINKRNSRRYRSVIPEIINSLNSGTFDNKFMRSGEGGSVNVNVNSGTDISSLSADVRRIKEQGETRTYIEGDKTITIYKNLKRTIR